MSALCIHNLSSTKHLHVFKESAQEWSSFKKSLDSKLWISKRWGICEFHRSISQIKVTNCSLGANSKNIMWKLEWVWYRKYITKQLYMCMCPRKESDRQWMSTTSKMITDQCSSSCMISCPKWTLHIVINHVNTVLEWQVLACNTACFYKSCLTLHYQCWTVAWLTAMHNVQSGEEIAKLLHPSSEQWKVRAGQPVVQL